MRILFVTPYVPSPVRVRPYQLIRALSGEGHQVHLVALQPPEDAWASADALEASGVSVDVFPLPRARTLWNGLAVLPRRLPFQAAYSHHPTVERHIEQVATHGAFDVVHVEHLRGAVLARRITTLPRVFDAVDSISLLFRQAARQAPGRLQRLMAAADLRRTRRFEARAPFEFDRTIVTSPADRAEFVRLAGPAAERSVTVVPNGVDVTYFRPSGQGRDSTTVLFTGKMSYHANAAAALFLARRVMPEVWRTYPAARLAIVGKGPSSDLLALASDPRVEVTGYLEDIRPWFARATVAAAPMLYGAGIQNKVNEAMASGVPVVATSRTGDALAAEAGRHFLVGDSTDQIASQILRVLGDKELAAALGAAGRHYVEQRHDWQQIARHLAGLYEEARATRTEVRAARFSYPA